MDIAEFDDDVFNEKIDHIDVVSASEIVIYFKDGRALSRIWIVPKRVGTPWTEERRAKHKEFMKELFTEEKRQQMSEAMKNLRRERGKAWCKEQ